MINRSHEYEIDERELATILAALRSYQTTDGDDADREAMIAEIASNGGTVDPLSDEEIDELCETLNCAHPARTGGSTAAAPEVGKRHRVSFNVSKHHNDGELAVVAESADEAVQKVQEMDIDDLLEHTGAVAWTVDAWCDGKG